MSSLDSTLPLNAAVVHPPFFFISGLQNVPYVKYYYVLLCFVYVVSVLGNSFVMFIICTESSLHTPKYMLILNLAVADVGSSTALIPNLCVTFLFDSQYISFDACLANMFFVFFFNTLQSHSLTVMAFDRMVAICLPLRYHAIITMPAIAVICTVVWVFVALFNISIVALITRLSFCKSIVIEDIFCNHGNVVNNACNDILPNYIMAFFGDLIFMYIPLILIILSYVFIGGALFKIASWEERFKALKTCSAQLMLVGLYYLPYIVILIASVAHHIPPNIAMINFSFMFAIRPMLNPIIYVLNTEEVKEFSKKKFKTKKNQQLK